MTASFEARDDGFDPMDFGFDPSDTEAMDTWHGVTSDNDLATGLLAELAIGNLGFDGQAQNGSTVPEFPPQSTASMELAGQIIAAQEAGHRPWLAETVSVEGYVLHPSLEPRGGVDPDDPDYWNQLAETRGD